MKEVDEEKMFGNKREKERKRHIEQITTKERKRTFVYKDLIFQKKFN